MLVTAFGGAPLRSVSEDVASMHLMLRRPRREVRFSGVTEKRRRLRKGAPPEPGTRHLPSEPDLCRFTLFPIPASLLEGGSLEMNPLLLSSTNQTERHDRTAKSLKDISASPA
jgi:hypothetical protein